MSDTSGLIDSDVDESVMSMISFFSFMRNPFLSPH